MQYAILNLALPGRAEEPAGVLLLDEDSQRLGVKLRRDWDALVADEQVEEEDAEILAGIEDHLKQMAREQGAQSTMEMLESSLNMVLRLGERKAASAGGFEFVLHRLYRDFVHSAVQEFVTHLPRYALRSAAGSFGEQMAEANEIVEWVEAPAGMRLSKGMFVCEVNGRSMEPLIPSGSLCVFRRFGAGSRQGKKVLVEDRSQSYTGGDRYTVKVFESTKLSNAEGWEHQSIHLLPLNPEFPVLDLESDPERYAVVAEYVSLLY
jgi:SOS-response transcriptional repressor LexA